jgi:hypothetical protein
MAWVCLQGWIYVYALVHPSYHTLRRARTMIRLHVFAFLRLHVYVCMFMCAYLC